MASVANRAVKPTCLRQAAYFRSLGVMSPIENYEELSTEFPAVWPEDHVWENVHDGKAVRLDALSALLVRHIDSHEVVVVVHSDPGVGIVLPRESAASYIAPHVLKHEIQVSDPHFKHFVAVSRSGVAAGWSAATRESSECRLQRDA